MLQNALVAGVLALMGWCLWVRRKSWRCRKDGALTFAIVLLGAGLLLTLPAQEHYLGAVLYNITGIHHLDDFLGHIALLSAPGAVIYAIASRIVPDDQIETVMRKVEGPGALAAALMLAAIVGTPRLRRPGPEDFWKVQIGPWLTAYWIIFTLALLYQLLFGLRMLRVLRQDPRSRATADLFIIACWLGVASVLCVDAHLLLPARDFGPASRVALCVPGTLVSVAATLSWRRRLKHEAPEDGGIADTRS